MGTIHSASGNAYDKAHITAAAGPLAVGRFQVQTTSSTAVAAPGSAVITPASMANINVFDWLEIFGGTGTSERVQVLAVTSTTFTAVFANTHSGTYNISTRHKIYVGRLIINKAGTGDGITLYDGNPNWTIQPGTAFAVITPVAGVNYPYYVECLYGLYYTVTGTAGDYTITFLDSPATA